MREKNLRGRSRAAASVVATMALFGGAAAVTAPAAQSAAQSVAAPVEDCADVFPVDELVADQTVRALSVVRGTRPDEFRGTVIGVVNDLIAPDLDMVMVEITPLDPANDKIGGIWQGMSGSPVYAEDGRLVGAIAYGLSWGPSWVAGVTPFEHMDELLPGDPAARVRVSDRVARRIAAETDVTARQASEGFTRLRVPMGVTGVSVERVTQSRQAQKKRDVRYLARANATIGTSDRLVAAGADTIVAGGNLAVTMSYGDVTMGGVGTATSVCGGGVVGFGHPANFSGRTSLSMHAADAVYVQGESLGAPFKVANLAVPPVGTIDEDRLTGISGMFGAVPETAVVTSTVTYGEESRTGRSDVSVPDANASVTFYQQLVNHDRVLRAIMPGSELVTWGISGDDNGSPFTLGMTDRYESSSDIAFASPWDVADMAYLLSGFEGVTIDDVSIVGDVVDDSSTWRVTGVQQRRDGAWVNLGRRRPALARAGRTLVLRVVLESVGAATRTVPLRLAIPARAAGGGGGLTVEGGGWQWSDHWEASSVEELAEGLAEQVRNDAVSATLFLETRRGTAQVADTSEPTEKVVYGSKELSVLVR